MLSVPFQQTARYIKEYSDEVTEKEKEVIDRVLIMIHYRNVMRPTVLIKSKMAGINIHLK